MSIKHLLSLFFLVIIILAGCENAANSKDAIVEKVNGKISIKLIGKRKLMSHSPNDLIGDNTYIDSLIIYTPILKEGKITDIEIPVPEGYYKFEGSLLKEKHKLTVRVFIADTSLKKLIPSDWDGVYNLQN